MVAKLSGGLVKAVAVVFTSLVAPVLVNVAVREIRTDEPAPAVPLPSPPVAAASLPGEVTRVIAKGVGRTPEQAVEQALRTALREALAAEVDARALARGGPELFEAFWLDRALLIRSCKDIAAGTEWGLYGKMHRREIAVELDRHALVQRLHAAFGTGTNAAPEDWRRCSAAVPPHSFR